MYIYIYVYVYTYMYYIYINLYINTIVQCYSHQATMVPFGGLLHIRFSWPGVARSRYHRRGWYQNLGGKVGGFFQTARIWFFYLARIV